MTCERNGARHLGIFQLLDTLAAVHPKVVDCGGSDRGILDQDHPLVRQALCLAKRVAVPHKGRGASHVDERAKQLVLDGRVNGATHETRFYTRLISLLSKYVLFGQDRVVAVPLADQLDVRVLQVDYAGNFVSIDLDVMVVDHGDIEIVRAKNVGSVGCAQQDGLEISRPVGIHRIGRLGCRAHHNARIDHGSYQNERLVLRTKRHVKTSKINRQQAPTVLLASTYGPSTAI